MAADPRKLKNDAAAAREHGKYKKALKKYLELERLEPADGGWSLRAAEMFRRVSKPDDAVAALERAVDKYVRAGFVVKAIAACKMILQIQPEHSASKERLATLNRQRGISVTDDRMSVAGSSPGVRLPDSPSTGQAGDRPPVSFETGERRTEAEPAGVHAPPLGDDARLPGTQPPRPAVVPPSSTPPAPRAAPSSDPLASSSEPPRAAPSSEPPRAAPSSEPPAPAAPPASRSAPASPPPIPPAALNARPSLRRIKPRTLPPGAPLSDVSLAKVVPDAKPELEPDGNGSGIFEIPLQTSDVPPGDNPLRRTLKETPLFSSLGPDAMTRLIEVVKLVRLGKGDVLFRQGEPGEALYVIAEGAVSVIAEGPPRRHLARLGEGAFFGEIALVVDQPRSATVQAVEHTQLLEIDRRVMSEIVEEEPRVLKALLRFLRARLVHRLIQTHPLFVPLGDEQRNGVIRKFRFLEVDVGGKLIEQGKRARGLFIFLSGQAEAVREQDGETRVLHALRPGDLCGEMSLLSNTEALTTIRVTKRSLALGLPADAFREMIMSYPPVLMVVAEIAEEHRRQYEEQLAGSGEYDEGHLTFY